MQEKLVSVCINAYNAEKYILKTVESVLNQTYKNLQIIIVDDCSTDSTYDLIKSVKDGRIEVYKTPFNGHMSFACNEALKYAKGEYLAHLDADDLWAPEKIEKQVAFLEENLEYGACFTHAEIIDENGDIADSSQDYLRNIWAQDNYSHAKAYRFFYDNSNRLCHSSLFVKTDIMRQINGYDPTILYLQDFDCWMRLLTIENIYVYPERLTLIRRHADNNSEMNDEKWKAHDTEFARIIYKSINLCPDDLFLEAFKDKLKFTGEHTHEEAELEKAFLLLEGPLVYKENPVLGLYKFSKLFEDEKYIKLAKEKFNFTTKDLYKIQTNQAYFNPAKNQELVSSLDFYTKKAEHFENACSNLNNEVSELKTKISDQSNYIRELASQVDAYKNSFLEIQNSFFWRLTAPARKISQAFKNIIVKNKCILMFFIFLKGFLKGGINGGINRLENFKTRESKRPSFIISNKRKKLESRHKFDKNIKFSILVPLYNTPQNFLKEMIDSVKSQTYGNWELCLADGSDEKHSYVGEYCLKESSVDKRIVYKKLTENKGISENTNECIKLATGDFIALFDHDDLLHPSVLFECMKVICEQDADYVYTDEAVFLGSDVTNIISYHFKPDFAYYNLLANNYICHFSTFKASLIEKAGMFRHQYDGSQDHDIILRLTKAAKNVVHIPKILYFWRSHEKSVAMDINSKTYAINAGISAVHDFLAEQGLNTEVESSPAFPTIYRIKYEILDNPKVSIIIPNKNRPDLLKKCITSITELSSYNNYEIIIIDNNSTDKNLLDYYHSIEENKKIKLVSYNDNFNYSAINNYGASIATGDYLLFLNSDIQVITTNWIEELLMYAQREDVGAVGAKLISENNKVQHAGVILGLGDDNIAGHSHYFVDRDNLGYMGKMFYAQNVSAVSAACMMLKRSVFEEIGKFDEEFKISYNDLDLCLRLRQKGYAVIFNAFCELYHYRTIESAINSISDSLTAFTHEEKSIFINKWQDTINKGDPYYNPNLSLSNSYDLDF